jgi:hypothetical protein
MAIRSSFAAWALCVSAALAPAPGTAAPIQLTFGGIVTDVEDGSGQVDELFPGMAMTATFVYDPAAYAAPELVIDGQASYHSLPSPPATFTMQIGPWSIANAGPFDPDQPELGASIQIDVVDRSVDPDLVGWSTTVVDVEGLDVPFLPGGSTTSTFCCSQASFLLIDLDADVLTSLALTDVPLDLASWDEASWILSLALDSEGDSQINVVGTLTSVTVQTVPEPSALAYLAFAALGLGVARRR